MTNNPTKTPSDDGPDLGDVVAACLAAVEESGSGAVDDFCARHPGFAKALRRRIDALASAGMIDLDGESEGPQRPPITPSRFGDYTVQGELGVGGMGVVYRATQSGLDREVAVKTIRPELLASAATRRRFEREIASVARLSHPGIVPVYASGEQGGVPWFAMERIAGASLAALLDAAGPRACDSADGSALRSMLAGCRDVNGVADAPLFDMSWREAGLTLAQDVAAALDHAHRAGVLHRDVKPSNILLSPDGRARLLDFGLARDEDAADGLALTRTGALVGSLPYMAPEQVRGETSDRRTDVYGLAATLTEWLTGSPPFSGHGEAELRAAILAGQPPAIACRNSRLPADLVAVLEKALDPDRDRRYSTAAEFAEDLGAVLELRPVSARQASAWLRTRRFAQRRPAATLAIVGATILATAVPIALLFVNAQIRSARDHAEARFADARDAIVGLAARVGDEDLRDVPGAGPVRLDVLERSLALFGRLLQERPTNEDLRLQHARLERQIAQVLVELARTDDARATRARAEATMRELLAHARPATRRAAAMDLADLLIDRSSTRGEPVLALLDEADSLLGDEPDATAPPAERKAWFGMVRQMLHNRAFTLHEAEARTDADRCAEQAIAMADQWLAESPRCSAARLGHAASLGLRGLLHHDDGRTASARRDFDAATGELAALVADEPTTSHRYRLGLHLTNDAHRLYRAGDHSAAEAQAREAVSWLSQLTAEQPYRRAWQRRLAMAHEAVGLALAGQDRAEAAVLSFAHSANALAALLALDGEDRRVALRLALAHYNCASAFLELDRRSDAAGHSTTAVEILTKLAAEPGQRAARRYVTFARVLEARAALARGVRSTPDALTELVADNAADDREAWFLLALAHADLAAALPDPAHATAAHRALERAIDAGFAEAHRVDDAALFNAMREDPKFRELRARLDH